MGLYKIYAGLGGGFGGAYYQHTDEYEYEEEALQDAYLLACEIFEGNIGTGMDGYDNWRDEAESEVNKEDFDCTSDYEAEIEEYMIDLENEARELWIDYYVKEVKEGEDPNEE